ncbi:hypothetical protein domain protein [Aspergillus fumigatus]|nr:hypothetical protein domain protein [Aspergillus fumigatus]
MDVFWWVPWKDTNTNTASKTRLTSTLRLLIPRLRLLQRKDTASSVIQRRELATLLDEGRESSARIRVENVIATDIAVEVMEMVELYCELLLARVNVLDQLAYIDAALDEAAAVIFYAWPRFPHDVRELTMLRGMLAERWGKEFMTLAQDNKLVDVRVPEWLVKGLRVKPPAQELVESYLREIAKAYGSSWGAQAQSQSQSQSESELGEAPREFVGDRPGDTDQPGDGDGDAAVPSTPTRPVNMAEARRASETSELNKATPPRGFQSVKSPVSVAPPGPRSDNPNPRVKVPGSETQSETQVEEPPRARNGNAGGSGGIPELDELARRFAALRR